MVGGVHSLKGPLLPQKEVAKAFELCKPIMLLCETDDRYGKYACSHLAATGSTHIPT